MHIQVLKVDWLWFTKNIHKYLQKGICMYMQVAISWQNWEKFLKIKHTLKESLTQLMHESIKENVKLIQKLQEIKVRKVKD